MLSSINRLWIVGLVVGLVAGCGGGGGSTGGGSTSGNGGTGTGGGNSSTTVTVTFEGPAPTAVATRIGTGAFSVQTLSNGVLSLSIPSGTSNYTLAFRCPTDVLAGGISSAGEFVLEASTADSTSFRRTCPYTQPPGQTGTLTGSVDASAVSGVSYVDIDAQISGSSATEYMNTSAGTFSLTAPAGNNRVMVLAYSSAAQGGLTAPAALAAKNFSSQTVPGALNSGNAVVLGPADETTPEPITYNNVPSGFTSPDTYTALYLAGGLGEIFLASGSTEYPALPAGALESGDMYLFEAQLNTSQGYGPEVLAGATNSGGPVSFTFPTPWTYAGPTPAALPSVDFNYAGFAGKGWDSQEIVLNWNSGSAGQALSVVATKNYQGSATTLSVPDLSALAGFWANPASGTQISWAASEWQSSYGLADITIPLNATWSAVIDTGVYSVP